MDITAVTALLNERARALYRGKIARGDGFFFYSGNAAEKFKEVLLSAAPCGKVLLLFDKSGFAAMGFPLRRKVRGANLFAWWWRRDTIS